MAEAIIAGIIDDPGLDVHITVSEPVSQRRQQLAQKFNVKCTDCNAQAVRDAQLAILAVKPQQFDVVAQELRNAETEMPTVISIMAGIQISRIREGLQCDRIIRVMPNTPAQIGQGASAWTASPEVDSETRQFTAQMLEAVGEQIFFPDEKLIDIATALSASGPAYVFLFIEALSDAAVQLGMDGKDARALAIQMILGSASLAKESDSHPAELKNMVTSPGGTTAAALHALETNGFRKAAMEAVIAAYRRGEQLA